MYNISICEANFINFNYIAIENWVIICFGYKKTSKEILTTGGEIMNLFLQEFILQTFTKLGYIKADFQSIL